MIKIPQRIRNRMEKWTAFTLAVIACVWFNNRLAKVEGDYKQCMEERVKEARHQTANNKSTYHEKNHTKSYVTDPSFLQATAKRDDHRGRSGRRDPVVAGCLTRDTDHRRRVRGNGGRRWRGYLPADEEGG